MDVSALARAARQTRAVLHAPRLEGDAFVAVGRGLDQLGDLSTFRGWLRTVVRADVVGADARPRGVAPDSPTGRDGAGVRFPPLGPPIAAAPLDGARARGGAAPERTPCPWLDRSPVGGARQPTPPAGPVEGDTPC